MNAAAPFMVRFGFNRDYDQAGLVGYRPRVFRAHELLELQLLTDDDGILHAAELQVSVALARHRQMGPLASEVAGAFLAQFAPGVSLPDFSPGWFERPFEAGGNPVRVVLRAGAGVSDRVSLLALAREATLCSHCNRPTLQKTSRCQHCQNALSKSGWWKLGWKR